MNIKIGFIGCGNMGGALARAVAHSVASENILLCDKDADKAMLLAQSIGAGAASTEEIARECQYIFLGVKPQMLIDLLDELSPTLNPNAVLVSMAAGIPSQRVKEKTGNSVIRIMPNTPVTIGSGMVWYSLNGVSAKAERDFCSFMCATGEVTAIDEAQIDAACALSGCGPAFAYIFAEALASAAAECGMDADKTVAAAAQTLIGAGQMMLKSGKTPAELTAAVCSPNGATLAGVNSLIENNFAATAASAVRSAYKRTMELKQ